MDFLPGNSGRAPYKKHQAALGALTTNSHAGNPIQLFFKDTFNAEALTGKRRPGFPVNVPGKGTGYPAPSPGRIAAPAPLGREFPTCTLSVVQRVPSSAIRHVSTKPPSHPGQSGFPSPVVDLYFLQEPFLYGRNVKPRPAYSPRPFSLTHA